MKMKIFRWMPLMLVLAVGGPSAVAGDEEPAAAEKKAEKGAEPRLKPVVGAVRIGGAGGPGRIVQVRGGGAVEIRIAGQGAIALAAASGKDDESDEEEKPDEDATTEDKIAAFLKKREADQRKPRAEQMQHRIDELEEIVGLSEGQQKKLEIASKGAVEKSMEGWREQMDNYVRQHLQRAPLDVDMVLASLGNVNFGSKPDQQAAEQEIWRATIAEVLDETQMSRYLAAIDERNDYLYTSVSSLLIADLDRSLRLNGKQRTALTALLLPVVEENLVHLGRWSNDGNLPVYQLPTLLWGVGEKKLKPVLSAEQIDGWKARCANFKGMWEAVKSEMEKDEEEAKEKAREEKREQKEEGGEKGEEPAPEENDKEEAKPEVSQGFPPTASPFCRAVIAKNRSTGGVTG